MQSSEQLFALGAISICIFKMRKLQHRLLKEFAQGRQLVGGRGGMVSERTFALNQYTLLPLQVNTVNFLNTPVMCNVFRSQHVERVPLSVHFSSRVDLLPVKFCGVLSCCSWWSRGYVLPPHSSVTGDPPSVCAFVCLSWCVLSLIACPQACSQCSHWDQCHLCDHGFLLKKGLCISSCVSGFSVHSSNETCAGKCFFCGGLVNSPAVSLCTG